MDSKQRQRIISRQRDALRRHGYHPNALFWSSREIQELRFRVLFEASGLKAGDSLLDVGCGFGDLAAWLARQGSSVDYTGIDLSPELLAEGRRRHPGIRLYEGDIFDFDPPPESHDWVVLSGALNSNLNDQGAYARRVIRRMYAACRKGIAFNLLDARHEPTAGCWDLQSFLPADIEALARRLSPCRELRDDYLENDFTVVVRRPGRLKSEP
jgi:SAM-dependent methyltransferase